MSELHERTLSIETRPRPAERLDVHAQLRDVRRVDLPTYLGVSHPPGVVHHMILDLELDRELTIAGVEAAMRTAPFEPSEKTRGEGCRHILPNYQELIGTKLDAGYAARVMGTVGGPLGCFHILSLAQCVPLAVRAASRFGDFRREMRVSARADEMLRLEMAADLRDHTAEHGTLTAELRFWLEIRQFTIVDVKANLSGAPFADGAMTVAAAERLRGLSVAKGFTAAALDRIGVAEGCDQLAALVIALTPVIPQASGAFAGFLKLPPEQKLRNRAGNQQLDSCHMWRAQGPLADLEASPSEAKKV